MAHKVFTKELLKSVNTMAQTCGYNRVVRDEFLDSLEDKFYIPRITLLHAHKAGKPCEPHVRCMFTFDGGAFFIDVEMGCWELVPTEDQVLAGLREPTATTEE